MSLLDILCLSALAYCVVLVVMFRRHAEQARSWGAQSETRCSQLFEDVPLACQETDLEGEIRHANQKFCDLRGLQPADIIGKHYADFAAEGERGRTRELTRRKLTGEEPLIPQKQTYKRKDGEIITVQVHETLLRDDGGAIVGLRSSALDVTEHIRKEEEIWQTTAELRAIFQALPDKFLRLDMDAVVLDYRGPTIPNFLGKKQELVGKSILKIAPEEVGRQFEKAISRVRKTSSMVSIEYSIPADYGGEMFFEARLI